MQRRFLGLLSKSSISQHYCKRFYTAAPTFLKTGRSVLDVVGGTPVIQLTRIQEVFGVHNVELNMKLEYLNPGLSVKARPAVQMILAAEKAGILKHGSTDNPIIVESSSGNTSIALAMACAARGYRFIPVVDVKMSKTKLKTLYALGAEVELVGSDLLNEGKEVDSNQLKTMRRQRVEDLKQRYPKVFVPNQYANPANPDAHILTTGPELLQQLQQSNTAPNAPVLDIAVVSVSTGGQLLGIGGYLKQHIPNLYLVAVEPLGSNIFPEHEPCDNTSSYYGAGSGLDYTPINVTKLAMQGVIIDEVIKVADQEAFVAANLLARLEGVLAGPSTGQQLFAAARVASRLRQQNLGRQIRTAFVACDSGNDHLDVFDADYLKEHNVVIGSTESLSNTFWKLVEEKEQEIQLDNKQFCAKFDLPTCI